MAHILHDMSGDIRILKSRYYSNISAAVRLLVVRVLGVVACPLRLSRADPRAAVLDWSLYIL